MTEEEARQRISTAFGDELLRRAEQFVAIVVEENRSQNLIASSTIPTIWSRHIWDSLQLVVLARQQSGIWIDIGSGGGFPGLLVALARSDATILVEPRKRRAEFLQRAVEALGLQARVTVVNKRMEQVEQHAKFISARAVAGIEGLLEMAHHCAGPETRWLLPRGRIAPEEIASLRSRWAFVFHVEHSDVDPASLIAVFDRVSRR